MNFCKNLNLLIVDDDRLAREELKTLLEDDFLNIYTAEDAIEGLEIIENYEIDIVITDINMPDMNGLEFAKALKSINPNLPVIIFSAHNNKEYLERARELNIDSYLLKPLDYDELMGAINRSAKGIFQNLYDCKNPIIEFLIDEIGDFVAIFRNGKFKCINLAFKNYLDTDIIENDLVEFLYTKEFEPLKNIHGKNWIFEIKSLNEVRIKPKHKEISEDIFSIKYQNFNGVVQFVIFTKI